MLLIHITIYDSTVVGGYTYENDRGKLLGNPVAEVDKYNSYTVSSRIPWKLIRQGIS
jgi:hypothetical protein